MIQSEKRNVAEKQYVGERNTKTTEQQNLVSLKKINKKIKTVVIE